MISIEGDAPGSGHTRLHIESLEGVPSRSRARKGRYPPGYAAAFALSRRSPCQGVRLNMRGGLGITAWRAMWPLWLHTRTRSRSRRPPRTPGTDTATAGVMWPSDQVKRRAYAPTGAISRGTRTRTRSRCPPGLPRRPAAGRPSTHGRTGRRGTAGGASANAFTFAVGVPAGVAVAPRDPELPRTRSRSRALSSRARDAGVGMDLRATTGVV